MGFYFNKIMIAQRQVLVQTLGPNFTIKKCVMMSASNICSITKVNKKVKKNRKKKVVAG